MEDDSRIHIGLSWEKVEEIFRKELEKSKNHSTNVEYVSCIYLNGRPIPPPVMTQEKRSECQRWKREAVLKEKILKEKRNFLEQSDRDENLVCVTRASSRRTVASFHEDVEEFTPRSGKYSPKSLLEENQAKIPFDDGRNPTEKQMVSYDDYDSTTTESSENNSDLEEKQSAFKSLIHKLRRRVSPDVVILKDKRRSKEYQSNVSVNTVVENPDFNREIETPSSPAKSRLSGNENSQASEVKESSSVDQNTSFRSRSDSYTLEEPSPLLKAYMDKFGTAKFGSASEENRRRILSPEQKSAELSEYLTNLSTAPNLEGKRVRKSNKSTKGTNQSGSNANDKSENETPKSNALKPKFAKPDVNSQTPRSDEKMETPSLISELGDLSISSSVLNSMTLPIFTPRNIEEDPKPSAEELLAATQTPTILDPSTSLEDNVLGYPLVNVTERDHVFQETSDLINVGKEEVENSPLTPKKVDSDGISPSSEQITTVANTPFNADDEDTDISLTKTESVIKILESNEAQEKNVQSEQFTNSQQSDLPEVSQNIPVNTVQSQIIHECKQEYSSPPNQESCENSQENSVQSQHIPSINFDNQTDETSSSGNFEIEAAVSTLANEQKEKVEMLLEAQAAQREQLRKAFEEQQKNLISAIVKSVGNKKQKRRNEINSEKDTERLLSTGENGALIRAKSPVIPAVAVQLRPTSSLPVGYAFPPSVYEEENQIKFAKLTALAKGFLTRRLMSTIKVQTVVNSIRESINTAMKLHKEARAAKGPALPQDVELQRRLLLQLNRDYESFHHIFFGLDVREKMSFIAMDHEIRRKNEERKNRDSPSGTRGERQIRRISEVTRAKLEQKKERLKMLGMRRSQRDFSTSSSSSDDEEISSNEENHPINSLGKKLTPRKRRNVYESKDFSKSSNEVDIVVIGSNPRRSLKFNKKKSAQPSKLSTARSTPSLTSSSTTTRKIRTNSATSSIAKRKPWK